MLISVVQKQTVPVSVVAAKSSYKGIDPFGLFRCDSYYNSNPSFGFCYVRKLMRCTMCVMS